MDWRLQEDCGIDGLMMDYMKWYDLRSIIIHITYSFKNSVNIHENHGGMPTKVKQWFFLDNLKENSNRCLHSFYLDFVYQWAELRLLLASGNRCLIMFVTWTCNHKVHLTVHLTFGQSYTSLWICSNPGTPWISMDSAPENDKSIWRLCRSAQTWLMVWTCFMFWHLSLCMNISKMMLIDYMYVYIYYINCEHWLAFSSRTVEDVTALKTSRQVAKAPVKAMMMHFSGDGRGAKSCHKTTERNRIWKCWNHLLII